MVEELGCRHGPFLHPDLGGCFLGYRCSMSATSNRAQDGPRPYRHPLSLTGCTGSDGRRCRSFSASEPDNSDGELASVMPSPRLGGQFP